LKGLTGNGEKIALTLLAASETAHVFSQFEPSIFTIRHLANKDNGQVDIRIGYIPALGMGLGIAGAISLLIKSMWPLVASIIVGGVTISVYEWALRSGDMSTGS
jgi:undecaprenyl pyrophosphate phosphatase UppP